MDMLTDPELLRDARAFFEGADSTGQKPPLPENRNDL